MVSRILELIRQKNLTPSQFVDEIGTQRSGMSHIISGRNNPSLEFVLKVLKRYPEVKAEWLLNGAGEQDNVQLPPEIKTEKREIAEKPAEPVTVQSSATLFDLWDSKPKPELKTSSQSPKKEKTGKKIEKIVVFYDDKTFREYDPEL